MAGRANRFDDVIQWIRDAFAGVTHPGAEELLSPDGNDTTEIDEFGVFPRGTPWEDVPLPTIDYNYDMLPLFSPVAYQFLLPAYLVAGLLSIDEPRSNVLLFTLYSLTARNDDPGLLEHFLLQISALTARQRNTVLRALEAIRDREREFSRDAEDAIRSYWGRDGGGGTDPDESS